MSASCNCRQDVNNKLAARNAALSFNLLDPNFRAVIEAYKIDTKKRGSLPAIIASYCPFCGTEYAPCEVPTFDEVSALARELNGGEL